MGRHAPAQVGSKATISVTIMVGGSFGGIEVRIEVRDRVRVSTLISKTASHSTWRGNGAWFASGFVGFAVVDMIGLGLGLGSSLEVG